MAFDPIKKINTYFKERREVKRLEQEIDRSWVRDDGLRVGIKAMRLDSLLGYSRNETSIHSIMGRLPRTYEDAGLAFQHHGVVMQCVNRVAESAADVVINFYKDDARSRATGARTPVENPLTEKFRYTNPWSNPRQFYHETYAYLDLSGDAYWYFEPGTGFLYNLRPDRVFIVTDDRGIVVGYVYKVGGQEIPFKAEHIVHHKRFNPLSDHYGIGKITGLALTIEGDFFARSWNRDFYRNSARPDVVLTSKVELSDKAFKRLTESWNKKHKGRGRAHKTALIEGGGDVKVLNPTQKDLDFIKGLKLNKDEIYEIFGVPSNAESSHANARQGNETFWLTNILPKIKAIWSQFNASDIARAAGIEGAPDTTQSQQIMHVKLGRANGYAQLVQSGMISPNEGRRAAGLSSYPEGDRFFMAAGVVPIDRMNDVIDGRTLAPAAPQKQLAPARVVQKEEDEKDDRFDMRRAIWKKYDKRFTAWEKKWVKTFLPEFTRQRDFAIEALEDAADEKNIASLRAGITAALKQFTDKNPNLAGGKATRLFLISLAFSEYATKDAEDDVLEILESIFNLQGEIDIFEKLAVDPLGEMVQDFGESGLAQVGSGGVFDMADPAVLEFIADKSQAFASAVSETTYSQLRATLLDKIESGAGMQEMAEAVRGVFDGVDSAKARRALTIARTEVGGASNFGQIEGFIQGGAESKEWVTSGNADVRTEHSAIDGEVVKMDETFSNGLQYPGDPNGSAGEVVNCQCTVAPVV